MTAYGEETESMQSKIRCNIIGLTMPNMDGEEVLEKIQKIKPDAMIIISVGYGEQQIQKNLPVKTLWRLFKNHIPSKPPKTSCVNY